jgi:hypothetical protein
LIFHFSHLKVKIHKHFKNSFGSIRARMVELEPFENLVRNLEYSDIYSDLGYQLQK